MYVYIYKYIQHTYIHTYIPDIHRQYAYIEHIHGQKDKKNGSTEYIHPHNRFIEKTDSLHIQYLFTYSFIHSTSSAPSTHIQKDRKRDGQTTDRQTDKQTERQTDRQMNAWDA